MRALTHRRSENHRQECWHIYYGDVHAGTIAIRSGGEVLKRLFRMRFLQVFQILFIGTGNA